MNPPPETKPQDIVVIGTGLVGLAVAMQLLARQPRLRVTVIDKDAHPASQQSGHNSGVIHSGIYYRPGSFKARFSVEGRTTMLRFCEDNDIPTSICGKLVVATDAHELPRLASLMERGTANGVGQLALVGPALAREIEPHVQAVQALWVPGTGIVNFTRVARAYAAKITAAGGTIRFNARLRGIAKRSGTTILETDSGAIHTRAIVNCAGLQSDLVARMAGARTDVAIIPFRGEYYTLTASAESLVRGLVYPVPDPRFPFLGVHFTRTMKGVVEAGPNAVLATHREGYRKRDVSATDLLRMARFPGFWRLASREWRTAWREVHRSLRKSIFVASLQRLIPEITASDLEPGGSGVRAQAVSRKGQLLDDFVITQSAHAIHVLNAPSPGATCSLVIGRHIADLAARNFAL